MNGRAPGAARWQRESQGMTGRPAPRHTFVPPRRCPARVLVLCRQDPAERGPAGEGKPEPAGSEGLGALRAWAGLGCGSGRTPFCLHRLPCRDLGLGLGFGEHPCALHAAMAADAVVVDEDPACGVLEVDPAVGEKDQATMAGAPHGEHVSIVGPRQPIDDWQECQYPLKCCHG